jgi:hypothetical protein
MVEIKQITAEEFLNSDNGLYTAYSVKNKEGKFTPVCSYDKAIEFAKLHVQAALKAKIEAMEEHMDGGYSLDEIDSFTYNAYPLENIK